jgi:leucyl aminopeptidase
MTEKTEVTKSAELDVDKIKEVVLNVLQSQKEAESEKVRLKAEDEAKIREEVSKIASEKFEAEKAKIESTYKEENEKLNSKILEINNRLEESKKASIPQTVAKPSGESSPFASQAEIAQNLVNTLNRK